MKEYEHILGKYERRGTIDFKRTSQLRQLAREIPEGICGVYMFVAEEKGCSDILYIGCSGHMESGNPVSRKGHGLRGRIYGKQEKVARDKFYKQVMDEKGLSSLKIHWFDTEQDDPEYIEYLTILRYITINGRFPEFNNRLERKENKALGIVNQ